MEGTDQLVNFYRLKPTRWRVPNAAYLKSLNQLQRLFTSQENPFSKDTQEVLIQLPLDRNRQ